MYLQRRFVDKRKPRLGIQNDVAVGVLYFVGIGVEVGLEIESERGVAAGNAFGINCHVRADIIPRFGSLLGVEVGQKIFHRIDGFVDSLVLRRVIEVGIVCRPVLYRITVDVRLLDRIAGDKHRRKQRRSQYNQCHFRKMSFHFASVRLPARACLRANENTPFR